MTVTKLAFWHLQAILLFGPDSDHWKFECPTCHLVQSRADFIALGLHSQQADNVTGYSCIRRWTDQQCMSAGNGPLILEISPGEKRPTFNWASS